MSFLAFVTRQALGLVQAVGAYLALVIGTPLLAMVVMTFVGYLPYSDRPGPGWYGLRLSISPREVRFFVDWWAFTTVPAALAAAVLFSVRGGLRAVRTPPWLLASVCGLASLLLSMYLVLATGWYIAMSSAPVLVAGLAGLVYGAALRPRLPIPLTRASGAISAVRVLVGGVLPVLVVGLGSLIIAIPRPQPEMAAALVVVGCSLEHEQLSEAQGGLTSEEAKELRRLGVGGRVGVVAIITPWTPDMAATGSIRELPIGEPTPGRRRTTPRTVIVVPEFPDALLELDVAFHTTGLYVKRDAGWTTIPAIAGTAKRVRIAPIRNAPGNVTLELEEVGMGSSFRYCR